MAKITIIVIFSFIFAIFLFFAPVVIEILKWEAEEKVIEPQARELCNQYDMQFISYIGCYSDTDDCYKVRCLNSNNEIIEKVWCE